MAEDRTGQLVVMFVSERTGDDPEGYAAAAEAMDRLAAQQPGYRGIDSVSAGRARHHAQLLGRRSERGGVAQASRARRNARGGARALVQMVSAARRRHQSQLFVGARMRVRGFDRTFALLFTVMLTIAAGNTALQSVLPALGRSLGAADSAVAAVFSVSALLWVIAAPYWANRSDRHGRRAMVLLGVAGFTVSLLLCGIFLALGINGVLGAARDLHRLHHRPA